MQVGWKIVNACLVAFFEVPQARIEHFFHAAEFGAPEIAHVVEASIHMRREDADQCGIEQHRDTDGEIELLVGHQSLVRSAWFDSPTDESAR